MTDRSSDYCRVTRALISTSDYLEGGTVMLCPWASVLGPVVFSWTEVGDSELGGLSMLAISDVENCC
jgi:hypothetical protein